MCIAHVSRLPNTIKSLFIESETLRWLIVMIRWGTQTR